MHLDEVQLGAYRQLQRDANFDWGREFVRKPDDLQRMLPALLPGIDIGRAGTIRDVIESFGGRKLAEGLATVVLAKTEVRVRRSDRWRLPTQSCRPFTVMVMNESAEEQRVSWAGSELDIQPGEVGAFTRMVTADDDLAIGVRGTRYAAVPEGIPVTPGRLELRSTGQRIWSVVDSSGHPWFPADVVPRWTPSGDGWFAATAATLGLPADNYVITVGDGEAEPKTAAAVLIVEGSVHAFDAPVRTVEQRPWLDADTHVHRNYSGTVVVDLQEAQALQDAAGLRVMALVAGNVHTSRIYDATLPHGAASTTSEKNLTLFGTEFRNDLYGHVVVLGTSPEHAYSGHPDSSHPTDDITPADIGRAAKDAGGVVIVAHPFWAPLDDDMPPAETERLRSVEAVFLPVAAALGAIDALELLSPGHTASTERVAHLLFDLGLRFALVAGSDTFLSFPAGPTSAPPGSARYRVRIEGELTEEAVLDAIRRRETIAARRMTAAVTIWQGQNEIPIGGRVSLSNGLLRFEIRSPDDPDLVFEIVGAGGARWEIPRIAGLASGVVAENARGWIAIRGRSAADPDAYFHTSPIFLDRLDPQARRRASEWAKAWIAHVKRRVVEHAVGTPAELEPVRQQLAAALAVVVNLEKENP